MKIRLFKPSDGPALKEIFKRQNVNADLPIPGEDPSVLVAVVGEEDGKPVSAIILRLTAEAHLVIDPDIEQVPTKIIQLRNITEGAALALAEKLRQVQLGSIDDIVAFVPTDMDRMGVLMKYLGFHEEPSEFRAYWRKLGT